MQRKAYRVYLTLSFVSALLYECVFTVSMLFWVTQARLSPLELVLLGTVLEAAVFLFEIPTGVVADVYSRRLSVVIGYGLVGAGFVLQGSVPLFWASALAQVLWGLGYTFTSGATQAWISDEIGEEHAALAFVRAARLEQLGGLVGIVLSVLLALQNLSLAIIVSGVLFMLLAAWLVWQMPEAGFKPAPAGERTSWQRMAHTLRSGISVVRLRPLLLGILAIGFVYGLYSEGYDRLWTASLLERFDLPQLAGAGAVVWFGGIRIVSMLLAFVATSAVARWVDLRSTRALAVTLLVTSTALVACLVGYALAGSLGLALALIWAISVLRQVTYPIYTAWFNHRLDPQVRATLISMSSQVDAFGQIGGGPLIAVVAQSISIQAGLLSSALLLTPVLGLLVWQIRAKTEEL